MGDNIVVVDLQFLYGDTWQFDLVNENTGQQIRMFMTDEELEWKMKNAINIAREVN